MAGFVFFLFAGGFFGGLSVLFLMLAEYGRIFPHFGDGGAGEVMIFLVGILVGGLLFGAYYADTYLNKKM